MYICILHVFWWLLLWLPLRKLGARISLLAPEWAARWSKSLMATNRQPVDGMDRNLVPSAAKLSSRGGFNRSQGPSAALNYMRRNPRSRFPSRSPGCWNLSHRISPSS